MFAKYKIHINEVREMNHLSLPQYIQSSIEKDRINLLLENEEGIIDGEKLKTEYFPTKLKSKYNVFISHSHRDIEEIERFAKTLEDKYGVHCFVDSMIWKNIADLQYSIDNNYSRGKNGNLDYRLVRQSTAHIHSLLSIALFEMIDQCECCIFVQSDNSLQIDFNDTTTLSPWIYEEIYYMNHTKRILPNRISPSTRLFSVLNESRRTETFIKMTHMVDLSDFNDFCSCLPSPNNHVRGDDFLNHLYWKSGLVDCSINTM